MAVGEHAHSSVRGCSGVRRSKRQRITRTVRPDGSTAVQILDALGKPKPTDQSKIILPNLNLSGAQK